jgi:hypothetical protein
VYWSKNLQRWNAEHRAVVLDHTNCPWSVRCIGMPSVLETNGALALFFDAPAKDTGNNMGRDIGLAWLNLPLKPPS